MKHTLMKWTLFALGIIAVITSSQVYSSWQYAERDIKSISKSPSKVLHVFEYPPEEVLPEADLGKNQVVLVESLVDGDYGLNTPDSYLNQQISARKNASFFKGGSKDTIGSMGMDQKDDFESLFSLESENLSFLIQFIDDTTYYIFTTDVDLGQNGKPNYKIAEENISPIYRTVLKKVNDIWQAQTSAKGYALSAYYEESNILGNITRIPSFDPDTWVAGAPSV